MNIRFQLALFGAGLATLAYLAMPALADEWDKQTTIKFSAPVEVPGYVLLPGTYVFRLADLSSDRDVMQVFRQDRRGMDHLVTTQFVAPAYQVDTPTKSEASFEERRSNTPEALHLLFYPGDNYGWEFIYPKKQRLEVAATTPPRHSGVDVR